MSSRPRRRRSPLLEAADVADLSRWQRWLHLDFRAAQSVNTHATAQAVSEPGQFMPIDDGNGIFGRWMVDEAGLPAYEYTLDQYRDARARYPNSENLDRRDHWHQVGNQRVTALASNDGTVQVYLGDRGGVFLNKFEAWQSGRSGGIPGLLARLLVAIVRFLARLSRPAGVDVPRPYAAASGNDIGLSRNPHASLSKEHMQSSQEEASDPLLQSYQVLAGQGEPLRQPQAARPIQRSQEATEYAYAGGFSYLDDGNKVWATAYRYRPGGAQVKRTFGMGYFETVMTYRHVRVVRTVYAPFGDYPLVLADVRVENVGTKPLDLHHYEYWDVNVHQLRVEWLRGGILGAVSDEERRLLNHQFTNSMNYRADENLLEFRQDPPPDAPPPDQPSPLDWYPAPIFLADMLGKPDAHYINKATFFGVGGAREPDAIKTRAGDDPFQPDSALEPMPYCMVLRSDFHLEPGQSHNLRFAYGAAWPDERHGALEKLRRGTPLDDTLQHWQRQTTIFWTGQDALLHREMAWHSYNLHSATTYNAFHKVHLVPQGSAYLYLHGADGAPRDQALFTLPMTYLDPELAQDMLRLLMRLADRQTGQIPYAFTGHGYVSNALNVHTQPSDLDLYFLLALTEYLAATRNFKFLNEEVAYYPPDKATRAAGHTVADHIRFALRHLFEGVGIGDHGLLRVRTGDWSDSITLETAVRDGLLGIAYQNSKAHGESIPNTQLALYVLPLLANILKKHAPDITATINDGRLLRLQAGLATQWNEAGWYNRAVLRGLTNESIPVEGLSLESQVWGLISGAAKAGGHEQQLLQTVQTVLDDPSPIGAQLIPNGMVWPAMSQLLTWAYVRAGQAEMAWRSLNRNTFAMHARQYPAIWYGIWSGPDGVDSHTSPNAGGAWSSVLTPMTDFPVMNANPDAMALLGLLRVCGIEPSPKGDGLVIRPTLPRKQFVLDTALLYLEVDGDGVRGEYRGYNAGQIVLYIYPPGSQVAKIVPLEFHGGKRARFAV